jgi:hypothetical protein
MRRRGLLHMLCCVDTNRVQATNRRSCRTVFCMYATRMSACAAHHVSQETCCLLAQSTMARCHLQQSRFASTRIHMPFIEGVSRAVAVQAAAEPSAIQLVACGPFTLNSCMFMCNCPGDAIAVCVTPPTIVPHTFVAGDNQAY